MDWWATCKPNKSAKSCLCIGQGHLLKQYKNNGVIKSWSAAVVWGWFSEIFIPKNTLYPNQVNAMK
mgnify:CR=1 FL=1